MGPKTTPQLSVMAMPLHHTASSFLGQETQKPKVPNRRASPELAPEISRTSFHLHTPNFLQGLKNTNPFSFPKAAALRRAGPVFPALVPHGHSLETQGRGSLGSAGSGQARKHIRLPCRRRPRKCIVCIRTPLSPPTLWWPCQS